MPLKAFRAFLADELGHLASVRRTRNVEIIVAPNYKAIKQQLVNGQVVTTSPWPLLGVEVVHRPWLTRYSLDLEHTRSCAYLMTPAIVRFVLRKSQFSVHFGCGHDGLFSSHLLSDPAFDPGVVMRNALVRAGYFTD